MDGMEGMDGDMDGMHEEMEDMEGDEDAPVVGMDDQQPLAEDDDEDKASSKEIRDHTKDPSK